MRKRSAEKWLSKNKDLWKISSLRRIFEWKCGVKILVSHWCVSHLIRVDCRMLLIRQCFRPNSRYVNGQLKAVIVGLLSNMGTTLQPEVAGRMSTENIDYYNTVTVMVSNTESFETVSINILEYRLLLCSKIWSTIWPWAVTAPVEPISCGSFAYSRGPFFPIWLLLVDHFFIGPLFYQMPFVVIWLRRYFVQSSVSLN